MNDRPNERQALLNAQRYLRQLSYTDDRIPPVPVDGVPGEATRRAIAVFQRNSRLPVTGYIDNATWDALFAAYRRDVEARNLPMPVSFFPTYPQEYSAGLGDEGILIQVIQILLRELLLSYGQDMNDLSVAGIYDAGTESAVKSFQSIHRLPRNGRVDMATWNRLAQGYNSTSTRYRHE